MKKTTSHIVGQAARIKVDTTDSEGRGVGGRRQEEEKDTVCA